MPPFLSLHAFAASRGEGLRPELRMLFERLAADPHHDLVARNDGMVQSGPDPTSAAAPVVQESGRRQFADPAIVHFNRRGVS